MGKFIGAWLLSTIIISSIFRLNSEAAATLGLILAIAYLFIAWKLPNLGSGGIGISFGNSGRGKTYSIMRDDAARRYEEVKNGDRHQP